MRVVRMSLLTLALLMAGADALFAQQNSTIIGTVVDESQAVLPGVTVTATEVNTGRQFVGVTNERGEYRLPGVAAGRYRIEAGLAGFARAVVPDFELLVGQNAIVNFTAKLASVSETVTVVSEVPLVDTQSVRVTGNVDPRQMEQLPINGRNWIELASLVKGVTQNVIGDAPTKGQYYQLNLDSQQITQDCCGLSFGNPKLSREAIAEYQVVTNMFDISQGRAMSIQVNAVTKSGTNRMSGSAFANFRDNALNAKDFIANRVLPYSNQQLGGTFGGPIVQDRAHYFGVFEYEREPQSVVLQPSALSGQSLTLADKILTKTILVRGDLQMGQKDHLTGRVTWFKKTQDNRGLTAGSMPAQGVFVALDAPMVQGTWSRVMSNTSLQELRVGHYLYHWFYGLTPATPLTPTYSFPGLQLGAATNNPQDEWVGFPLSARYELTSNRGKHDLKFGAEFLGGYDYGDYRPNRRGSFAFSALPADAGRRFPLDAWTDPSRWDFSGLDSTVLRFDQYMLSDPDYLLDNWHEHYSVWLGDTWRTTNKLTLNLGLRYDLPWNELAVAHVEQYDIIIDNGLFTENVGPRDSLRDYSNLAPRAGFAWDAAGDGSLVLRGGSGLFYGTIGSGDANQMQVAANVFAISIPNDGRPGFLQDPLRGATVEDFRSGRRSIPPQSPQPFAHDKKVPLMWQNMIGFQKQLNEVFAVDADLVYQKGTREEDIRDPNLFYDPATGMNKNPTRFGRPNPAFGPLTLRESKGRSDYLAVPMSLTRRFRDNWQVGAAYTLMFFKDDNGGRSNNPFDREGEWARAEDFQRHTLRVNGVYQLPWDLLVAGLLRYGSGNPQQIQSPANPLGYGTGRTRADLTEIPRNTFEGDPYLTVDFRLGKTVRLGGNVRLEGTAEVFNVFNFAHYEYNRLEGSPLFGSRNGATAPRQGQLAFKVTF